MIHHHILVLMFSPSCRITPPEYDLPAPISESYQLLKRQGRPHWARHASSSSPRKQVKKGFFNTRTRRKGKPAVSLTLWKAQHNRLSIVHRSSVGSILIASSAQLRVEDDGRSGGENCFDTQQEKHDTGLAKSSCNPLKIKITTILHIIAIQWQWTEQLNGKAIDSFWSKPSLRLAKGSAVAGFIPIHNQPTLPQDSSDLENQIRMILFFFIVSFHRQFQVFHGYEVELTVQSFTQTCFLSSFFVGSVTQLLASGDLRQVKRFKLNLWNRDFAIETNCKNMCIAHIFAHCAINISQLWKSTKDESDAWIDLLRLPI